MGGIFDFYTCRTTPTLNIKHFYCTNLEKFNIKSVTVCNRECLLWLCCVDTEGLCDSVHSSRQNVLECTASEGTGLLCEGGSPWTCGAIFLNTTYLPSITWPQCASWTTAATDSGEEAKEEACQKAPNRTNAVWCLCAGPEEGQMVACDNQNCRLQWYHFHCVGLVDTPSADTPWFCPSCAE